MSEKLFKTAWIIGRIAGTISMIGLTFINIFELRGMTDTESFLLSLGLAGLFVAVIGYCGMCQRS